MHYELPSPFHQDEEDVDVAWRYAWDSGCLGESLGIDGGELLPCFGGETVEFIVFEVTLYADILQSVHLFSCLLLALDISLILHLNLRCLRDFLMTIGWRIEQSMESRQCFCNLMDRDARTSDEFAELASTLQWGSADGIENGVYFLWLHIGDVAVADDVLYVLLLLHPPVETVGGSEADGVRTLSETGVGIVLSEEDAIFRSGGKHTIRFIYALCDEIVDEYTDIRFVARECERLAYTAIAGGGATTSSEDSGIDAGDNALSSSFLISRGAIDLSGKEESGASLAHERVGELGRVEVVILYGVARSIYFDIAQGRNLSQRFQLNLDRHTAGESVEIHLICLRAFRFEEERMVVAVGESDELGLY